MFTMKAAHDRTTDIHNLQQVYMGAKKPGDEREYVETFTGGASGLGPAYVYHEDEKCAKFLVHNGVICCLRNPLLQLKMDDEIRRENDLNASLDVVAYRNSSAVEEIEAVVACIVGVEVTTWTCDVLRRAHCDRHQLQQLHRDWDKAEQLGWSNVWVGLYYPAGGSYVNSNGELVCMMPGQMLLFAGRSFVHAAGLQPTADAVRWHFVFVPTDDIDKHRSTDMVATATHFVEDPTMADRVSTFHADMQKLKDKLVAHKRKSKKEAQAFQELNTSALYMALAEATRKRWEQGYMVGVASSAAASSSVASSSTDDDDDDEAAAPAAAAPATTVVDLTSTAEEAAGEVAAGDPHSSLAAGKVPAHSLDSIFLSRSSGGSPDITSYHLLPVVTGTSRVQFHRLCTKQL